MDTKLNVKSNVADENFPRMEKQKLMSAFLGDVKKAPLKTIQPSADRKHASPKTKPVKKMISSKIWADKTPLKIFEDKKRVFQEFGTQTEGRPGLETGTQTEVTGAEGVDPAHSQHHNDSGIEQEAYDLMVKEPIPESYWRELAEERRLSLAEALSENEMLHQSMEELKEENLNLSQMASQAEYLATTLNSIIGDDEESETKDTEETEQLDADSSEVFTDEKEDPRDPASEVEEKDKVAIACDKDTVPEVPVCESTDTDCKHEEECRDVQIKSDENDSTQNQTTDT